MGLPYKSSNDRAFYWGEVQPGGALKYHYHMTRYSDIPPDELAYKEEEESGVEYLLWAATTNTVRRSIFIYIPPPNTVMI